MGVKFFLLKFLLGELPVPGITMNRNEFLWQVFMPLWCVHQQSFGSWEYHPNKMADVIEHRGYTKIKGKNGGDNIH